MKRVFLAILLCVGGYVEAHNTTEAKVEHILSQMTLKEKIDYIGGHNYFSIRPIPRLKLPEIVMADGPAGVREHGRSTGYPSAITIASSWNTELTQTLGQMIGSDARSRGVHILLTPGVNICRSPLCGRNFEYFGEDPHLTSRMAVSVIKGIQSQNVVATIKHFACNNQEWNRNQVSSDVDERTLREIYLPAFEAAVKEADVGCVMAGYNLVNGTHMTEHKALNVDLLKNEWGFTGILMSDWTSTYDGIEAANGGLDLEMPYGACMNRETLFAAIQNGKIDVATIDDKVRRILRTIIRFGFLERPQTDYRDSFFNHKGHVVARKMAEEGMVLLKNDGTLPLNGKKIQSLAVIGPCALGKIPVGSGSSEVKPHIHESYIAGIANHLADDASVFYASGVPEYTHTKFTTTLEGRESGLKAEYFTNPTLRGEAALTRVDSHVKFQWKEKSYQKGGPVNHYSVRWTGYYAATKSGDHTFYISGNDGFRLHLNDVPLIDHWMEHKGSFRHVTLPLEEGKQYKVCLEYYVKHGPQGISFWITPGKNLAIERAKEAAASCDAAIVCAGFGMEHEGEDWDRTFFLPLAQDELIKEVASANPRTIVVMSAGGNVDMSDWLEHVNALLYAWYPGQEGAKALGDILFGKVSPSGKLPVTFEKSLKDSCSFSSYHDTNDTKRVAYSEGIFVGYRHFDRHNIEPQFPFGFGLSYTTFSYSNAEFRDNVVSVDITNRGQMIAKEVAQVYVRDQNKAVERPEKELKGFTKVELAPGETKRVTIPLDERAFSYYDTGWKRSEGPFEIVVGNLKLRPN